MLVVHAKMFNKDCGLWFKPHFFLKEKTSFGILRGEFEGTITMLRKWHLMDFKWSLLYNKWNSLNVVLVKMHFNYFL